MAERMCLTGSCVVGELLVRLDDLIDVVAVRRIQGHRDADGPVVVQNHVPGAFVQDRHFHVQFLSID